MHRVIGVIPARYGSTRFPGKPLVPILGKTLLRRTYESARLSRQLDHLVIATDNELIFDHAKSFGADVIMTSESCQNGTERLADAMAGSPMLQEASILVNIQGDEPCIEAEVIDAIIETLRNNPQAVVSTAAQRLTDPADLHNPSIVKCVLNERQEALYFSRAPIPYFAQHSLICELPPHLPFYGHLGIYAYRREFLKQYASMKPTPLQLMEDLEQLKILERGYTIQVAVVHSIGLGVNEPEDIKKVEQFLCSQNISLSLAE